MPNEQQQRQSQSRKGKDRVESACVEAVCVSTHKPAVLTGDPDGFPCAELLMSGDKTDIRSYPRPASGPAFCDRSSVRRIWLRS